MDPFFNHSDPRSLLSRHPLFCLFFKCTTPIPTSRSLPLLFPLPRHTSPCSVWVWVLLNQQVLDEMIPSPNDQLIKQLPPNPQVFSITSPQFMSLLAFTSIFYYPVCLPFPLKHLKSRDLAFFFVSVSPGPSKCLGYSKSSINIPWMNEHQPWGRSQYGRCIYSLRSFILYIPVSNHV